MRKKRVFPLALFLFCPAVVVAQFGSGVSRVEAGAQFTELALSAPVSEKAAGVGGRFSYNFSRFGGVDADANHFPGGSARNPNFGETTGFVGARIGYATDSIGLFAKIRPGFIHFAQDSAAASRGLSQNYFALDVGAVLERYFKNHTFVRLDFGDTVVPYGNTLYVDASGTSRRLGTQNNPSASIGFGFYF